MRGSNTLTLCPAALIDILQAWIDRELPGMNVIVSGVRYCNNMYDVQLDEPKLLGDGSSSVPDVAKAR